MVGIEHQAEIKLTVTLNKKGLTELRRDLKSVTDALNTQKAVKQMSAMEENMKKLRKELSESKKEVKALQAAQNKAATAIVAAERKTQAEIRKTRAERQKTGAAIKASAAAETKLMSVMQGSTAKMAAYLSVMRKRYGAEKTLEMVQKSQAAAAMKRADAEGKVVVAYTRSGQAINKLKASQLSVNAALQKGTATFRANAAAVQGSTVVAYTRLGKAITQTQASAMNINGALARGTGAFRAHAAVVGGGAVVAYTRLGKAITQTQAAAMNVNGALARGHSIMQKGVGFVQRFSKSLSEAEGRMDALFRASFRLSIVGFTLQRFASNIMRWGSSIMDVFEEFEFTMLRAAGALEIWIDEMWNGVPAVEVLQQALLGLTKELVMFESNDVAEALYFWGSATGQVVDDVEGLSLAMGGLGTIMKTAAMTNTDYETTIKGVYSILSQFYSGELSYATEVTEKLFLSTQKTAAEFTDLIQAFKMVGPVAAQIGSDFDQVNEAFGKLSDLGLRGSIAGRGLRQMFIQIARPSGPAQKKLDELFPDDKNSPFGGKSFYDVTFPEGNFVGIEQHVTNLAIATERLNAADRVQAIARITTANSLPLTIALMAQQRNELLGLTKDIDKFKDADPSEFFRKNWEALSTSWKGVAESFKRVIEALKIDLGSIMSDVLTPLVQRLNEVVEGVQDFILTHPALVRTVTQFAAIAAAVSAVAGTMLIAAGSLIGLAAAMGLIWGATERWRKALFNLGSVVGVVFLSFIENFEYIHNNAIKIVDNLNKALEGSKMSLSDLAGIMEAFTRPLREIIGFIIRLTSDLLVMVTGWEEFMAVVTSPAITGALKAILYGMGAIFAGAMVNNVYQMVKGLKAVQLVITSNALTDGFRAMLFHLKAMVSGQVISGLRGLIVLLRGVAAAVWASTGPVGVVVAGIALLAGAIMVVSDLTKSWSELNSELEESASYFGKNGVAIANMAAAFSDAAPQLDAARKKFGANVDEINDFIRNNNLNTIGAGADENGKNGFIIDLFPSDLNDEEAKKRLQNLVDNISQFAPELTSVAFDLGFVANDVATALGNAGKAVAQGGKDFTEEWTATHKEMLKEILRTGRDIEVSGEEFADVILSLLDNVTDVYAGGTLVKDKGSIIDDIANYFITGIGDEFTFDELRAHLEKVNQTFGVMLGEEISLAEALKWARESGRLGESSSAVNDEFLKWLEQQLSVTDPVALQKALTQPLEIIGGKIPLNLVGNADEYGYAQILLEKLVPHYDEVATNVEAMAQTKLDAVAEILKGTLTRIQGDFLLSAIPDTEEVALILQDLALGGEYAEMAAALLTEPMGEFASVMEAVAAGYDNGGQYMAIAKALVEAGYGGEELARYVEDEALEDGSKAGETAAVSLRESFVEAFNAIPLNIKDEIDAIKKAKELGSGIEAVARAIKQRRRAVKVGFGADSNAASRAAARDVAIRETQLVGTRFSKTVNRADRAEEQGKTKRAKNLTGKARTRGREYLNEVLPDYDNAPKFMQDNIRGIIKLYAEQFPSIAQQVIDANPDIKWPKGFIEGLMPTKEDAEAALSQNIPTTAPAQPPLDITTPLGNVTDAATNASKSGSAPSPSAAGEAAAKELIKGYEDGTTVAQLQPAANSAIINLGSAIDAAEAAASSVLNAGKALGSRFARGFESMLEGGEGGGGAGRAAMVAAAENAATSTGTMASLEARSAGEKVGSAWADGFKAGLLNMKGTISVAFAEAVESGEGASPPKVGPLKHIDKWGENIGSAWSSGVIKGMRSGEEKILSANAFTGAEIAHRNKQEITIKLEVTSPDGSVNRQKQGEMRRGALEAIAVSGLEHYMTVE